MDTLSFADWYINCPQDTLGGNPQAIPPPKKKGNVVTGADPIKESGVCVLYLY